MSKNNNISTLNEALPNQAEQISNNPEIVVIRNFVPPKFRNLKPPEIGKVK